jgi:tetratricopeptide (TPR) repeat protein
VAEGALAARTSRHDVDDLLLLALSRPHEALAWARTVLRGRPDPYEASVARQATGIVLRDSGDVNAGVRELRRALQLARQTGTAEREADVLGSLGTALVHTGRTADGLAAFDHAIHLSSGVLMGRVLHRRGIVLWTLGRFPAALNDFRSAISALQRAGDQVWTARALSGRGLVYLGLGSPARADADFVAAGHLYAGTGQELEAVHTVFNRATVAFRSGDFPAALSFLDEAASRYGPLNVPTPFLSLDRCAVLAAGLASEALAEAEAIGVIEEVHGQSTKKAELLVMAANCALAAAQPQAALDRARVAYRLFQSQQNAWGQAHAGLALAQARYGVPWSAVARSAGGDPAEASARLRPRRPTCWAGGDTDTSRRDEADRQLSAGRPEQAARPGVARATGWLSAGPAGRGGRRPAPPARCPTGRAGGLDEFSSPGASELRAQATDGAPTYSRSVAAPRLTGPGSC